MKQLALTVESRDGKGRGNSRRLRNSGKIPAIIYGKSGSRSLSIGDKNFRDLLRTMAGGAAIIELTDDKSKKFLSVLHETHRDACTDHFLHVDFREVSRDTAMQFSIPVHVFGESTGVKNNNGTLEILHHNIDIRCLPDDLPSKIDIDVSHLDVHNSIHLKDIKLPAGVTAVGDADQVVVICAAAHIEKEPVAVEVVADAPAATDKAASPEGAKAGS
jgi:large subunit ribosomal protein L25